MDPNDKTGPDTQSPASPESRSKISSQVPLCLNILYQSRYDKTRGGQSFRCTGHLEIIRATRLIIILSISHGTTPSKVSWRTCKHYYALKLTTVQASIFLGEGYRFLFWMAFLTQRGHFDKVETGSTNVREQFQIWFGWKMGWGWSGVKIYFKYAMLVLDAFLFTCWFDLIKPCRSTLVRCGEK